MCHIKIISMYKIWLILFLSLSFHPRVIAINLDVKSISTTTDTLPMISLREVVVLPRMFKNRRDYRQYKRYNRLVYNVQKAYPYAQIAAKKINDIEERIANVHSKSQRKQVIQEEYRQLMKTFKKPLMKLSITQGKILVRLIYRETNNTSFHHIQEYKGNANAYFWQSIALLFGNNLKADYDPEGADREIEEIVREIERMN